MIQKRIRHMHPMMKEIAKSFICPGVNANGCGKHIFHIEKVPDPNEKIYQILCISGHSFHVFIETVELGHSHKYPKLEKVPISFRVFRCVSCNKKVKGFYHHNVTNCPDCRRTKYGTK